MIVSLIKNSDALSRYSVRKREELISFIISVTVAATAFLFAYNSLERLTYPTPVSFSLRYFGIISFTAAVKLLLFFVLKVLGKKADSTVVRLMSLDSLLDFFITAVTVLTLLLSKDGRYTVDAFSGIGISVVILVSAVKNVIASSSCLMGTPQKKKKEALESLLEDVHIRDISFDISGEKNEVFIFADEVNEEQIRRLSSEISKQTGIKAYFITGENKIKGETI